LAAAFPYVKRGLEQSSRQGFRAGVFLGVRKRTSGRRKLYGLLGISETAKTAMQRQQDVKVELLRAWDTTSTGNERGRRDVARYATYRYLDVGRGIAMQDCDGALVCVGE